MGQPIEVSSQPGASGSIRIFTINRSVTGMRLEEYRQPANATGPRWVDELARRLAGVGVTRLTIYSSTVIAELPEWTDELVASAEDAIRELYVYYVDGVIPPGDYTGEEAEPAADPEPQTADAG